MAPFFHRGVAGASKICGPVFRQARLLRLILAGVAKYVGNELKMEASARSQPKKDTIPATARRGESPPHGTVVAIVVL